MGGLKRVHILKQCSGWKSRRGRGGGEVGKSDGGRRDGAGQDEEEQGGGGEQVWLLG